MGPGQSSFQRIAGKKNEYLIERIREYLLNKDNDEVAPPELMGTLEDVAEAWMTYTIVEALDWKYLPSQVHNEDDVLMNNIFAIASRVNKLRKE